MCQVSTVRLADGEREAEAQLQSMFVTGGESESGLAAVTPQAI
jgi:hypothetical protein